MIVNDERLTKSDFLLFCDAPRHLWAKRNGKIEQTLTDFAKHLSAQGYEVEKLAQEFLRTILLPQKPGFQILFQQTFEDQSFEARVDVLLFNTNTNDYELYEVKSSTSHDKEDLYDIAYQYTILQNQVIVNKVCLVHLNKDYVQKDRLDLSELFIIDDLTEEAKVMLPEIKDLRRQAQAIINCKDPNLLAGCLSPRDCPCPSICHPQLPEFSIFDIPRLSQKHKQELLAMGIRDAKRVPANFSLNAKQKLIVERARTNSEYVDRDVLISELQSLRFPLWFLDYETCISALPKFPGYHPQQQIVFQYSLHRLEGPQAKPDHQGYIALCENDPSRRLLEHLSKDIGAAGTIIVWNKAFEMTMNKEMAKLHPDYEAFLLDLNSRIYDLGEIINRGIYLHPLFKGSWSIKHVLPAMVPELSYTAMPINKGDQASMAWWNMTFGDLSENEKRKQVEELERYCELDTLAMVAIYQRLLSMVQ